MDFIHYGFWLGVAVSLPGIPVDSSNSRRQKMVDTSNRLGESKRKLRVFREVASKGKVEKLRDAMLVGENVISRLTNIGFEKKMKAIARHHGN
jgi:hypothetical protein